MQIIGICVATLLVIWGCSTSNKGSAPPTTELMPPEMASWPVNDQFFGDKDFGSIDLFLSRVARENPGMATTWWADYRRAQLWSQKDRNVACENFSRLAAETHFPIRRLAYLHAHEVCPKNNQILARLEPFNVDQFDPWLANPALDVAIKKARQSNDRAGLVEYNLRKSKGNLRKEEKVAYTDTALRYAKKLGDKNKIKELLARIYNLSPSRMPNPQPKDYLSVALDYRYVRNFDKALKYFNKVVLHRKIDVNEKLQALRGIRTMYKIQQKKIEAVKATEKLSSFVFNLYKHSKKTAVDAKLYVDTQLLLARTYWTEDQAAKARRVLDRIPKVVGNRTSLAEYYWIRGRMDEEQQKFASSIEWFKKALNEPIDSPSFQNKINWYMAWNLRKTRDYKNAVKTLKALAERSEDGPERSRILFWLGRTYAAMGEKGDAKDALKDLISEDGLSYYGLVARRESGEPLPTKVIHRQEDKKQKESRTLVRDLRSLIDTNYLEWLVATRESAVAGEYLDTIATKLRKEKNTDEETWSSLFHQYARAENYIALFNQLNLLKPTTRKAILDKNPEIIFPNPYFEAVTQAANRFGISAEFIYSIMRQESSFNPQARSQMDAFGLMQLLPQVARRSAEANAITLENEEDLYEPFINIPIGSAYLRELWDKYNGELVLAVASYNASESAIVSWLKTRFRGDTLEFIEDIPYDETRDYVKLVLRNLITYQILNAREETISFPEWTLKISYQGKEN